MMGGATTVRATIAVIAIATIAAIVRTVAGMTVVGRTMAVATGTIIGTGATATAVSSVRTIPGKIGGGTTTSRRDTGRRHVTATVVVAATDNCPNAHIAADAGRPAGYRRLGENNPPSRRFIFMLESLHHFLSRVYATNEPTEGGHAHEEDESVHCSGVPQYRRSRIPRGRFDRGPLSSRSASAVPG